MNKHRELQLVLIFLLHRCAVGGQKGVGSEKSGIVMRMGPEGNADDAIAY